MLPLWQARVVAIHARPDREARQAQLTIRLLRADILAPKTLSKEELFPASIPSSVPLWVVSASEETSPRSERADSLGSPDHFGGGR